LKPLESEVPENELIPQEDWVNNQEKNKYSNFIVLRTLFD
jgi:hypothetical protein